MKLGVTATRQGLTKAQRDTARFLMVGFDEVHDGDCVGGDDQLHEIAEDFGARTVVHPPEVQALRAWNTGHDNRPEKLYHDRNRDIVDETDELHAYPAEDTEQTRGGTWYTVRYARSRGKPVTIVWPDGTVQEERAADFSDIEDGDEFDGPIVVPSQRVTSDAEQSAASCPIGPRHLDEQEVRE